MEFLHSPDRNDSIYPLFLCAKWVGPQAPTSRGERETIRGHSWGPARKDLGCDEPTPRPSSDHPRLRARRRKQIAPAATCNEGASRAAVYVTASPSFASNSPAQPFAHTPRGVVNGSPRRPAIALPLVG